MHSNNPMIPFTLDDLRINATIRHELIIETLVTLARGNRGNTATPRNLPRGIGIQIGKVRIHVMHAMVMSNLSLHAIRQKLSIYLAAADHPRNGFIGHGGQGLDNAMHNVDTLGRKILVAGEHDIAAILERSSAGKTQQRLASHNDRATFGARHKMAHIDMVGYHHVALAPNTPVVAHGDNG